MGDSDGGSIALRRATACVERRDWVGAVAAYGEAGTTEADVGAWPLQDQLRRNLAMNFAELASHRPAAFAVLERTPADRRFGIEGTPSGRVTVSFEGKSLTLGDNPLASLAATLEQLKTARQAGQPLALLGTGDGYLLAALARHPVALQLGREQCVYLFEVNPANLLSAMMLHNYSGANGPIQQKRFQWYVGPDCMDQFRKACLAELALPWPEVTAASQPSGAEIATGFPAVLDEILAAEVARGKAIAARGAAVDFARLIDATSPAPKRRPRALLLTTRFSTVLRYSTADMAEALEALGWEAEVVMEPSAHHTLTFPLLRDAMLRTDPDVVFQLDHTRAEHADLFPAAVPFVCWAQDNLPNLINRKAGAAHGALDFFMTGLGPWFVREFGYPAKAIIPAYKYTKPPAVPEAWESDGPDLAYVSTASKLPELAVADYLSFYRNEPQHLQVGQRSAERLLALYAEGKSISGTAPIAQLVMETADDLGIDSALVPHQLSVDLFEKVNNLCYRQQALRWVAELADEMGLTLEIYGSGWEAHPRFAKYFKGFVQYGPELEALTRRTKINLQIVPYLCVHQRLIDGLAAGGFFLVRSHPADTALPALTAFLESELPAGVRTLAEARQAIAPERLGELDRLAGELGGISDLMDAVEFARDAQALALCKGGESMPPGIAEVSFGDKAELRERVLRFLPDAGLRRAVVRKQREATLATLSYESGMRRVIADLHGKLKALAAERETSAGRSAALCKA